jgi:hypothetical protein
MEKITKEGTKIKGKLEFSNNIIKRKIDKHDRFFVLNRQFNSY